MLDQKWIREHTDDVATLLQNRNDYNFPLAKYIELDSQRKKILSEVEVLKEKRNIGAKKIANLKKEGEHPQPLIDEMRELGEEVKGLDERASDVQRALDDLALRIPNKIHDSVPIGKDETFNLEIRKFGTPKQFNFQPKPHWEICEPLGLMDFERGVKIAESRFTVMFAEGARLVRGLINFIRNS
jgi:seryl-tRNA synthetase